jgi:outer membrane immunogenic protein
MFLQPLSITSWNNLSKLLVFIGALALPSQIALAEDQRLEAALKGLDAAMKRIDALETKVGKMSSLEEENKKLKRQLVKMKSIEPSPKSISKYLTSPPGQLTKIKQTNAVNAPNVSQERIARDMWQGMYMGFNAGYGKNVVSSKDTNYFISNSSFGHQLTIAPNDFGGPLVGGQVGYNYQFANNIIAGIELDFDYADITNGLNGDNHTSYYSTQFGGTGGYNNYFNRVGIDWLGTARARLGYNFDRFYPYITAGFAYGQLSMDNQQFGNGGILYFSQPLQKGPYGSFTNIGVGWVAGAGAEYIVADNLSVKGEYLFTHLNNLAAETTTVTMNNFLPAFAGNEKLIWGPFGIHQVRVGLNYHINWIKETRGSLK